MFIREIKKPNNRISIRIVENERVNGKIKQKTVCSVGHCSADDTKKISTFKKMAEELLVKIKNNDLPTLPGFEEVIHASTKKNKKENSDNDLVSISSLAEVSRLNVGVRDVFGNAYDLLNLHKSIQSGYKEDEANEILKKLVLARIDNPVSKRKSAKEIKKNTDEEIDLDRIYRMMDKVYENTNSIKDLIKSSTLSLFNYKVDVAFFDVTTLYFESFTPDNLRNFGFSKDKKFKETQIVLALITTSDGLPLGYELFPGNTFEGHTLITVIDQFKKTYDIANTLIVADRGMFSRINLQQLEERDVKFIVAAKVKAMKKDFKNQIINDIFSAKKEYPNLENIIKEYSYEGKRLIVSYCSKRAKKDFTDREKLVTRLKTKMKNGKVNIADLINNSGTKKYLKIDKGNKKEGILNEDKVLKEAEWDGIHGVLTNESKENISAENVLSRYRGLWQIEAAFRVNKHDLKMRPIFHWTEKRIRAHILICFMAYTLLINLRVKLKKLKINLSIEEIKEELNSLQESILRENKTGRTFRLPSKITANQRLIYKALNLRLNEKATLVKM